MKIHMAFAIVPFCLGGALLLADETPAAPAAPAAVESAAATPSDEAGKATESAPAKPAEAAAEPKKPPEEKSAGDDVLDIYPIDGQEWLKDPFLVLDMEMEAVVTDFGEGKPKPPAIATQPRIVSRFDTLIEMLEKKCSGSGPGGRNPLKPAEASTLSKGPGGMGELAAPKKNGKGYEDLTPKEREKILQSKTEGFPPGFEDVLADYFRRLSKAEEAAPAEPADKGGSE
jgi:hypothetical protein